MTTRVVAIVSDEYSCTVAPEKLLANVEDEVTFQNLTTDSVTITFKNENPFGCKELKLGNGRDKELPQDKKLPVKKDVDVGSYPYKVYCHGKGEYTQASIPRIIIHRLVAAVR